MGQSAGGRRAFDPDLDGMEGFDDGVRQPRGVGYEPHVDFAQSGVIRQGDLDSIQGVART